MEREIEGKHIHTHTEEKGGRVKEKEGLELLRMEVICSLKNRESCCLLFSGNYKNNFLVIFSGLNGFQDTPRDIYG